jgi:hypothetical protein
LPKESMKDMELIAEDHMVAGVQQPAEISLLKPCNWCSRNRWDGQSG